MPKPTAEETLDSLLEEAEKEVIHKEVASGEADRAIVAEIESLEAGKAATELNIERDILFEETDITRKIESELWTGAHIACLPAFYEKYTIQAQIEANLQEKYNRAILATCSRFKALGRNGLAMVSPLIDFIGNHTSYTPAERRELGETVESRIVTWLRLDIMPDSRPRSILARSLNQVVTDIVEAEQVFLRSSPEAVYMEGEAEMAAVKAVRNSLFLPNVVKIRLLQALSAMPKEEIYDIGTFLLWEIRKSSQNSDLLLYTMLKIFKKLNSSLI